MASAVGIDLSQGARRQLPRTGPLMACPNHRERTPELIAAEPITDFRPKRKYRIVAVFNTEQRPAAVDGVHLNLQAEMRSVFATMPVSFVALEDRRGGTWQVGCLG